ncbi:MAG: hypothetical protein RSF82_05900, partial [Angelakisella sp.]
EFVATVGSDPGYGARPIRRTVQNKVEDVIADSILKGEIKSGDRILCDVEEANLRIRNVSPFIFL